jgi:site-specific DNA-adenine methylase
MIDMSVTKMKLPKSPFRFPGGKSKVASTLRHYRPKEAMELRDAFVGGGSMALELGFAFDMVWINDLNRGLIDVYEALRDRPEEC